MNRKPSRLALAAVALLCVVSLVACCSSNTPVLRYVTVAPTTASIDNSTTQQFSATGYYSDGTKIDVTSTAGWTSSNITVATVSGGTASALANGTTTITATLLGASGSATLNVIRTIKTLTIATETPSIPLGLTAQYTATASFLNADGTTSTGVDVTSLATWNTSTATVATVTAGTATALKLGTTNISASFDGLTSAASVLTVTGAVPSSLQVLPAKPSLAIGNSVAFVASELNSDGTPATPPLSGTVTWAETCTPAGSVLLAATTTNGTETGSGQAVGSCTITATEGSLTGSSTVTVAVGSTHFAYIANSNDGTVSGYAVTASSATPLVPLTPPTTTLTVQSQQVVVHPSGKYLYSIDINANVHEYDISSSGSLTLVTPEPSPLPNAGAVGFNYAVIDPTGRFLYVTNNNGNYVYSFPISQVDGSLGTGVGQVQATLNNLQYAAIGHEGKYGFVVSENNASMQFASINQTNGTLTGVQLLTTGADPLAVTIDPSNKYVYTANSGDNSVSAWTYDSTAGTVVAVTGLATVSTATFFANVIVDPTSTHIYILDAGDGTGNGAVYGYNLTNGAIGTAIAGTPIATGVSPTGIVIDPTGTLLLVDNNGGTPGSISMFTIGTGGALTPTTPPTVATGNSPYFLALLNAAP